MKRISMWLLSTVSAVVLLFSYSTSTSGTTAASTSLQTPYVSGASSTSGSSSSGSSSSESSGGTDDAGTTTVTGSVESTRWGPVQIELTVADGAITQVSVLQYPSENGKDVEINNYALPILVEETISAQSASIDMVSGATVTSDGYVRSLQSALDQADL